ncbi:hypothetical protein ZWY2020_015749 [Hordeum vulgare]|nr:hypothetical protein ZWY2020_015749 [Hordeum vulgare]
MPPPPLPSMAPSALPSRTFHRRHSLPPWLPPPPREATVPCVSWRRRPRSSSSAGLLTAISSSSPPPPALRRQEGLLDHSAGGLRVHAYVSGPSPQLLPQSLALSTEF